MVGVDLDAMEVGVVVDDVVAELNDRTTGE